jgi:hypothetical protein
MQAAAELVSIHQQAMQADQAVVAQAVAVRLEHLEQPTQAAVAVEQLLLVQVSMVVLVDRAL